MASVILAGTPAEVVGAGGGGGVQSIVGGQYITVDNTSPTAPVVSSTLAAGDGITISGGVIQAISANLAAGAGITITPPVGLGDPITIAATGGGGGVTSVSGGTGIAVTGAPATPAVGLNFSTAAAEFDMLEINPDGTINSGPTNFVPAYTGWYVFQPTLVMGQAGFAFPAGSSVQFWVQQGAAPDANSFVCFTSASEAPAAGLGKLEDTRNAVMYLTAGLPYTAYVQWSAGVNMGAGGGASVFMVPLFA